MLTELKAYKVVYVGGTSIVFASAKWEAYVQFNAKWPRLIITDVELA